MEGKVIVQWCVKGLSLPSDEDARDLLDGCGGLQCNWWRAVHSITPRGVRSKLTMASLDRHVNHFEEVDPATAQPFRHQSPYISLSAGVVERDSAMKTNFVRRARQTALWFGTEFGEQDHAYLYVCWVVLSPRPTVEIEGVAEEIRDLNNYRRYSPFQTEGEVTAKIAVPDNQIASCERWDLDRAMPAFRQKWVYPNPRFTPPEQLSNVRELI
jgi:hypothetical protein